MRRSWGDWKSNLGGEKEKQKRESSSAQKKLPWVNVKMRKRKRGAWKLEPISWAQMKYIKILSSCPGTAEEDKEDINNFLGFLRKGGIDELNKGEARELISKLLERRVAQGIVPSAQRPTVGT
jgi:hypothetical protein